MVGQWREERSGGEHLMMEFDGHGRSIHGPGQAVQVMVPRKWGGTARREPATNQDIVRTAQIVCMNEHIDIPHRPETWIGIRHLGKGGALQHQQPYARSMYRAQGFGQHAAANGARVRVLDVARTQPIERARVTRDSRRLQVCKQERLEEVRFRGIDERAQRQPSDRCRQRSFDQAMTRPLRAERQGLEDTVGRAHDIDAMSWRAAACASPRRLWSAVARSTVSRRIGIVRAGG